MSPFIPLSACNSHHCNEDQCKTNIECEYENIVHAMKRADSFLPRYKSGTGKHWWTETLSDLKKQSIETHEKWKACGKPRSGSVHEERLRCRAKYRKAIKDAQKSTTEGEREAMIESMASKDTIQFWQSWRRLNNKNGNNPSPTIDGKSGDKEVAEIFRASFQQNCVPNNVDHVNSVNDKFDTAYASMVQSHTCKCNQFSITFENVFDAVLIMKSGKCCDDREIFVEHILNGPVLLFSRLQILFDSML
jgi:hypothetical protein